MKHVNKKLCSMMLLSAAACTLKASVPANTIGPVTPYIAIRSQGYDAARNLVGWTEFINRPSDDDCNYFAFYALPEYTSTFRSNNIFNSLFGLCTTSSFANNCNTNCNTGCNTSCNNNCKGGSLQVSGSRVANRGATDLLADYFYLPTDFQSTLNFNPQIQNVVVDLSFYWGLDGWCDGLFARLDIPVNWTRWNLNFCETIINAGTASGTAPLTALNVGGGYAPGYFAYDAIPTSDLLNSFASYANGNAPATFADASGDITFNPLNFARFNNCARTLGGVADLQAILGWNFLNSDDYHLGVGLFVSAPTGSRPTGQYLFEPVVGNGGSWALGAHITSGASLWTSCDHNRSLSFYLDCNITHLFKARQTRTFDLVSANGTCLPLSRYMLAETLGTPAAGTPGATLVGDGAPLGDNTVNTFGGPSAATTAANAVFQNVYTPVANFSTQQVKVSVGVQGDLAAQLTYNHDNFQWDVGYNFWGRSCEKISLDCNSTCTPCNTSCNTGCPVAVPTPFAANTYALKGDASVYGEQTIRVENDNDTFSLALNNVPVPLSATQTLPGYSDITGGSNFYNDANFVAVNAIAPSLGLQNTQVDNAQTAYSTPASGSVGAATEVDVVGILDVPIETSIPAAFLTTANIANCQGTRGISHKIYTNLSWNWSSCECWTPFLGIGGFAEFGPNNCKSNCNTACNTSANCNTNCNTSCNTDCNTGCNNGSCLNAAISQWGVWVKFGVAYN